MIVGISPGCPKGQEQEVSPVGWPTHRLADRDLKPELAYGLTKSLVKNKNKRVKAQAGFKNFHPSDAWKIDVPLHPGAAKYYREKGFTKEFPTRSESTSRSNEGVILWLRPLA
jgi:TRAP-type uncharacterized transport system substrate-binding protein